MTSKANGKKSLPDKTERLQKELFYVEIKKDIDHFLDNIIDADTFLDSVVDKTCFLCEALGIEGPSESRLDVLPDDESVDLEPELVELKAGGGDTTDFMEA